MPMLYLRIVAILILISLMSGCSSSKIKSKELWEEGRFAMSSGDKSRALVLFQRAINKDESNVNAHMSVQILMEKDGLKDECIQTYKNMFSKRPSEPWRRFLYARLINNDEAQKLYEIGISSSPSYPWFYYGLSFIREQQGDLNSAKKLLEQALTLDPSIADAYVRLGRLYSFEKQLKIAGNCFKLSIEHDRFYPDSYFYLGNLELLYGRIDSAYELYQQALKIAPDDIKIKYAMAKVSFLKGRYEEAYSVFKELSANDSRNARFLISSARALFMSGKITESLSYLDGAYDFTHEQGEIHLLKLMIFIKINEYEKAEAEFYLAEKFMPENAKIQNLHAFFYLANGKDNQAKSIFEKGATPQARGVYFLFNNNNEEAVNSFKLALKQGINHYPNYIGLGRALNASGKTDEAIEIYNKALNNYPKDGLLLFLKSKALADKGEINKSLVCFIESLESGFYNEKAITGNLEQFVVQPRVGELISRLKRKEARSNDYSSYKSFLDWNIYLNFLRI